MEKNTEKPGKSAVQLDKGKAGSSSGDNDGKSKLVYKMEKAAAVNVDEMVKLEATLKIEQPECSPGGDGGAASKNVRNNESSRDTTDRQDTTPDPVAGTSSGQQQSGATMSPRSFRSLSLPISTDSTKLIAIYRRLMKRFESQQHQQQEETKVVAASPARYVRTVLREEDIAEFQRKLKLRSAPEIELDSPATSEEEEEAREQELVFDEQLSALRFGEVAVAASSSTEEEGDLGDRGQKDEDIFVPPSGKKEDDYEEDGDVSTSAEELKDKVFNV